MLSYIFWRHVSRSEPKGCWIWTGIKQPQGYGIVKCGKQRIAHRLSYMLHNSEFDQSKHVLHACDNPSCIRPSHLWLGTHQDNMKDRDRKGRGRPGNVPKNFYNTKGNPHYKQRGESNGFSKLNSSLVSEIRKRHTEGESMRALGRAYSVSDIHIARIVKREAWNWL